MGIKAYSIDPALIGNGNGNIHMSILSSLLTATAAYLRGSIPIAEYSGQGLVKMLEHREKTSDGKLSACELAYMEGVMKTGRSASGLFATTRPGTDMVISERTCVVHRVCDEPGLQCSTHRV